MAPGKYHSRSGLILALFTVLFPFVKTTVVYGKTTDTLDIEAFIIIVDFMKFDDDKQQLHADFVVNLNWKHIKPIHPKGSDTLDANLDWIKSFQILNEASLVRKKPETEIEPDGKISLRTRFLGTINENLIFKDFPFDRQVFNIDIVFPTNRHFRLHLKDIKDKNVGPHSIANWTIEKSRLKPYELHINKRDLHGFTYQVQVIRKKYYYFLKVFLPIALIVFMSWTVFWVDPKKIDAQLTVSSTAMLSLIAFLFSLSFTIPKISYLTKMDIFLYTSLIFIFLALLESIYTSNLSMKGKYNAAKRTDQLSRYFFSIGYFVVLALIYFL